MGKRSEEIQKHFDDLMYALLESGFKNTVDKGTPSKRFHLILL
jgi:hypothetical protein